MTIVKDEISNLKFPAPLAQWLRRPPSKRKIVGSIPTGGIRLAGLVVMIDAFQALDPGSIPGRVNIDT